MHHTRWIYLSYIARFDRWMSVNQRRERSLQNMGRSGMDLCIMASAASVYFAKDGDQCLAVPLCFHITHPRARHSRRLEFGSRPASHYLPEGSNLSLHAMSRLPPDALSRQQGGNTCQDAGEQPSYLSNLTSKWCLFTSRRGNVFKVVTRELYQPRATSGIRI